MTDARYRSRLPLNRRSALLVMACASLLLASCSRTSPFLDSSGNVIPGSIATMETHTIGGVEQFVMFRGVDTRNPPLILLHGGPGASESPLFRHYNAALEQQYLVVYWDQRGAGRSYHRGMADADMTIDRMVHDLGELVALVKERFGQDKVFLLGHSWGTVLGTLYAYAHPESVYAYVGIGQIADSIEGETASWNFAVREATERHDEKALKQLREIGPPPHTLDRLMVSRKWVEHFGGSFHTDMNMGTLIQAGLSTDEFNWTDIVRFGRGNEYSLEQLWPQQRELDLTRYTEFEVPIFFLLGRYDWQVPSVTAAAYFEEIEAPEKHLIWFENSGHNPPFEEPERFDEIVTGIVRAVAATEP